MDKLLSTQSGAEEYSVVITVCDKLSVDSHGATSQKTALYYDKLQVTFKLEK
jgi:hypothetical protein